MRKWLPSVLAVLRLSVVQAQGNYLGLGLTALPAANVEGGVLPLFGLQAGEPLLENLELRARFDTLLLGSTLAADVLHRLDVGQTTRLYLGVAPTCL